MVTIFSFSVWTPGELAYNLQSKWFGIIAMQPDSKNINPLFIQPFRCLCHLCRLSKKSFVRFNMMRDKGFFKLDWHWVAHALTNQSSSLGQQGLKLSLTSNNYLWVTHCIMTCGWNSTMGLIAKAIKDALEAMGFSELCDCQRKTIKAYLLQRVVFVSAPTIHNIHNIHNIHTYIT